MAKPKQTWDTYQEVTDKIVALIEAGTLPWRKDWKEVAALGSPFNPFTRRAYNGINVVLLWAEAAAKGYASHEWGTYKQLAEAGGTVRKGEKGTRIMFYRTLQVEDRETEETKRIPMLRTFTVFNVAQCDGLKPREVKPLKEPDRDAQAEAFIAAVGADVRHGGNRAFFSPLEDYVNVPALAQFKSTEGYYATALHELTHWTGHKTRLARDFSGRFGSESYAFEELVAELGASFLCADLQLSPRLESHASYLDSWLKVLKGDKKAIFKAAAEASRAAAYLKALQPGADTAEDDDEKEAQA